MKIFRFASKYVMKNRLFFVVFAVLGLLSWSGGIILPYMTGKYVDVLTRSKSIDGIHLFTRILVCIIAADIIIRFVKNILFNALANRATYSLNIYVLEHIRKLPLSFFNKSNTAYLNQRINQDSSVVISFFMDNVTTIFINILSLTGITLYVFSINSKVASLLILLIPLYVFVHFIFRKPLYTANYDLKEKQNIFFSMVNDQLGKIKLVKINSWFETLGKELVDKFEIMYKSIMKYAVISNLFVSSGNVVSYLAKIIVFFFGGIEVVRGKMSVGEFTAVNVYFNMILDCTTYFIDFGKSYQGSLVSYIRLHEILDLKKEPNGTVSIDEIRDIELRSISFSYNGNRDIMRNFSYKFVRGNIYCVSGKNGAGKSTLVNLIIGLEQDYNGEILYNSRNTSDIDMYNTRKMKIGVSEQEPTLIGKTIKENIFYGGLDTDINEVLKWCENLQLNNLIEALPDKLDSEISERACNLSGGEKQKMSLVRTFIKNPDVIILDEPTSAMDISSIDALKNVLSGIKKDRIIIVITHSDSLLDISDHTIQMDQMITPLPKL